MIPERIKEAVESHAELNEQLLSSGHGLEWRKFNRTAFEFVARRINRKITQMAIGQPLLVLEKLILGKDQFQALTERHNLTTPEKVSEHLQHMPRPFVWISGKTLHSYWNKGTAKETKLNALLTFLNIAPHAWDDWKHGLNPTKINTSNAKKNASQSLIRKYFLGSYFLYYQKSDNSPTLIKAPFLIGEDERGKLFAQTVTEGHPYKSQQIELREGILYIHCENEVFDEKENHIFNVGNETEPEVLFGISNTISVKTRLAIGIRNVLVKQKNAFTKKTFAEHEISLQAPGPLTHEEEIIHRYFKRQAGNLMLSQHCCPLKVLEEQVGE